jgi:two-component system OmpR family response regulator
MGRKILLIEDDRETASYLAKGLGQEGHSVEQATNGQDGLFRATDGSFDLIVLDRMLPGLDGLSVLKALRAAQIDTPILILFGRLSGEAFLLRRAAGAGERAAATP